MKNFNFTVMHPENIDTEYWFIFQKVSLLVNHSSGTVSIPSKEDLSSCERNTSKPVMFGHNNATTAYYCAELLSPSSCEELTLQPFRELFGILDDHSFSIATRALQIVNWDLAHQFCGRCGNPMERSTTEFARICPKCSLTNYPRLSPAIIVAVVNYDKILLARGFKFPIYSVLAGYVEVGESLEETVLREVEEEVGVKVKNIKYFGSQSLALAFSYSLMLAFTAEYESGEIKPDGIEIKEAAWFTKSNLPSTIPRPLSISRKLIDWFVNS